MRRGGGGRPGRKTEAPHAAGSPRAARAMTASAIGLALGLALAPGPATHPAAALGTGAPDPLPRAPGDLLLVGDSVTAGMQFLSLDDAIAAHGWAARLLARFDLPPDPPRLDSPFPIDYATLAREGFGFGGWRFPWHALPALRPRHARFTAGEIRRIVAVPAVTLGGSLRMESGGGDGRVAGRIFGDMLLPAGLTMIGTAESMPTRPRWIVVYLGNNDLLAGYGVVGPAEPPSPEAFAADLEELSGRLRRCMAPGTPPSHLLLATVPDVTRLPFRRLVPPGANDGRGRVWPPGTRTSAFLAPYRRDRFTADEVRTPSQEEALRARARLYGDAVRALARREGYGVVDLAGLLVELEDEPGFRAIDSPWFSPDLHHPSARTHAAIERRVAEAIGAAAGVAPGDLPPPRTPASPPPPSAADLDEAERRRALALMRNAMLGLQDGHFPPRPTARVALEAGGAAGPDARPAVLAALAALESSPGPVSAGWHSRGTAGVRAAIERDEDGSLRVPPEGVDFRLGLALEPIGRWSHRRLELGGRVGSRGRPGLWARAEAGYLWVETTALGGVVPTRWALGARVGAAPGRPGRNGN